VSGSRGRIRAALARVAAWRVPLALLAATLFLAVGLTQPILHVSRLVVFTRTFSILDGIEALFADGDWAIALLLVVFSVVFPLLKIVVLALLWLRLRRGAPPPPHLLAAIESVGKWSMLDVFVVALVIFALKAGSFTDATPAPALYPFVAAILLTAYASHVLARGTRRA
jgi:paraquat-inducible protein A